jgi:glycosyltransferase involved in cell wall biosynthesis
MRDRIEVLHPITRMIVGGAQLNTLYTCRLIDKDRFRATLLTGPELGSEGDLLSTAREQVPTVVISSLGREIRPWQDVRAYRSILSHLGQNRYSIVHTHTSKAGILARFASHRRRVPIVVHTAHGWQWTHARGGIMNRLIIESERRAARVTDRIIVVAERDRQKGLEAGVGRPEQYVLIESAIALDEFDPRAVDGETFRTELGIPLDAPVVGTVGRFAYQKAPEIMLQAALKVLSRSPRAHFVYVGDGPLRDRLVSGLGLEEAGSRLHLTGIRREVPAALAAMDVFALSSRYEGLPRVAVEAMAMGKPVVTTPADGVVDVVIEGETGCLVPFEDPGALADALLRLIHDTDRARAMGEEGRRRVRSRFDVARMVRRIEELYEEVLEEKRIA